MSITPIAIKNNRVTLMAVVVVLLGGLLAFINAPKAEDPGFDIKVAQVYTNFPGASPSRVERLVTDKLEKSILQMPELKALRSQSKTGISIIQVELKDEYKGAKLRPVWDKLRRKVTDAQGSLPAEASTPTVNDEFGDVFGTVVALTGDGYDFAELKKIADDVRDDLLKLPEVAKVEFYGNQDERVFIDVNVEKLSESGLTAAQLRQLLEEQNIVKSGGSLYYQGYRFALEPSGNFENFDQIGATLIKLPGSRTSVRLDSLTTITKGYISPASSHFRSSGQEGIALAISMRQGGNIITLGEDVKKFLNRLESVYPWGVNFEIVTFQPQDVQETISAFTVNLLQSIGIVLISMLIFLGFRSGLIVASLVPTTMAGSLLAMSFLHIGLDKVTLAALVIALGLLVDNGVVMAESTLVNIGNGKTPKAAAISAATELSAPLLISSLTTMAAFMPLALATNSMGEFLGPLALVVSITLFISWLVALTVVPMCCALLLRPSDAHEASFDSKFYRVYRSVILAALKRPVVSLAVIILSFAGSLQLFKTLPQQFMSDSNLASFTMELKGPRGQDIARTTAMVKEIEDYLKAEMLVTDERPDGLLGWGAYIGNGGPRFYLNHTPEDPSPEYAFFYLSANTGKTAEVLVPKIRTYIEDNYPDIQPVVKLRASGGAPANPIGYEIMGMDSDILFANVRKIQSELEKVPGVTNVRDDWGQTTAKLVVDIDDARLKRAQLTNEDVAISLQAAFDGFQVTNYREDDKLIPTLLRVDNFDPYKPRKTQAINVFSQAGGTSLPLAQVAKIGIEWEAPVIRRKARRRKVEIQANLLEGHTAAEVNAIIVPIIDEMAKSWPFGYSYHITGEFEKSNEANVAIGEQLPMAMFVIVMLLVLQFNSIRKTAIVLFTIPLGLIGVILGLWICSSYFGFMALLGLISLAGIVVNNAIVLLDRIKIEIEEVGNSPAMAVVNSAQQRLRPILLTTATTILGLIPLWLGDDPMWVPMAIALIFGLLVSTMLTLGVVPIAFAILFRVKFHDFDYDAVMAEQANASAKAPPAVAEQSSSTEDSAES